MRDDTMKQAPLLARWLVASAMGLLMAPFSMDLVGTHFSEIEALDWAAIKAIVESAVRTKSADFKTARAYLLGDEMTLDGYKGTPSSFRTWDNQLRQPVLLRTHNAIIERAPIKGFLHPTENMDTLGYDRGDQKCQLKQGN